MVYVNKPRPLRIVACSKKTEVIKFSFSGLHHKPDKGIWQAKAPIKGKHQIIMESFDPRECVYALLVFDLINGNGQPSKDQKMKELCIKDLDRFTRQTITAKVAKFMSPERKRMAREKRTYDLRY